jgi:hypothetical protein
LNMDADIFVADSITRKERKNDGSKELGQPKSSVPKAAVAFPILVAEWPRSEREVLRIMLSKYQGRIGIDVRAWFRTRQGG